MSGDAAPFGGRENAPEVFAAPERLVAIVESSHDPIISKDLNGIVNSWNAAAEQLFGYKPEEILGLPITFLMPEERVPEEQEILGRIRRGDRVVSYETVRRTKDGRDIDVSITVSPIRHAQEGIVGASTILRDITAQKVEQRQRTALYQLTGNLHSANSLEEVYRFGLLGPRDALSCERVAILLADENGRLRFVAAQGLSGAYQRAVEGYSPWANDASAYGPIPIEDAQSANFLEESKLTLAREGISALAFIPILANSQLLGKLGVYYNSPHSFSVAEMELSEAMAKQIGVAIRRLKAEHGRTLAEAEARNSEMRLAAEASALRRLTHASSNLWGIRELNAGLREILVAAVDLVQADKGIVQLLRPDGSRGLSAHHGFDMELFTEWKPPTDMRGLATERALENGKAVFIEDTETDSSYESYREATRIFGYRALHAFPIISRDGASVGVLALHFSAPTSPDENNVRRLNLYLRQAADFIDRVRLDSALTASAKQERARAAQLQTIMDATPAGVWIAHDPDCMRITGNKAAMDLLRFPQHEEVSMVVPPGTALPFEFFADGRRLELADLPLRRAA